MNFEEPSEEETKIEERKQEPSSVKISTQATEKIDGKDYEVYGEWQIIDSYGDESGECASA